MKEEVFSVQMTQFCCCTVGNSSVEMGIELNLSNKNKNKKKHELGGSVEFFLAGKGDETIGRHLVIM